MSEITVKDLDQAVTEMVEARKQYDDAKELSNAFHAKLEERKERLLQMLEATGKSSYKVDGVGTVSKVEKLKVSMPTTPEAKEKFFSWLLENEGKDGFNHYATVNYQSLNSLYNQRYEEATDKSMFEIPGIKAPEVSLELRFKSN